MNETLLWLFYLISGGAACIAVYRWRWRVWVAVLAGVLITTIGWLLIFRFTDEAMRPDWVRLDLALNLTFGLFFSVMGAALGWRLLSRQAGEG